jgi:tripartite ATP-independent transporter DctP family solute receptor
MRASKLAVALMAIGAIGAASAQEKIQFKSADIQPIDYPTVRAVKHMGELLSERTNGRLSLKVFADGALGSEKEAMEQVKIGALAMTRVSIVPFNNICPDTIVPTMPFLYRNADHLHKFMDSKVGEEILKSCEPQGYVLLAYYDSGARSMYGKKPFRTLADMKGAKVRVQPSDLWVDLLAAMGANPSPMPMGEVYTALKTGLIDAAENNYPSYEAWKHYESAGFYSKTEHAMAPEVIAFSKVMYDKLSKADQEILRQAAKDSVTYMRRIWEEKEKASLAKVIAAGAQIIEVDKKPFQDAMAPVYAKYIKTDHQKALLKAIQDLK